MQRILMETEVSIPSWPVISESHWMLNVKKLYPVHFYDELNSQMPEIQKEVRKL